MSVMVSGRDRIGTAFERRSNTVLFLPESAYLCRISYKMRIFVKNPFVMAYNNRNTLLKMVRVQNIVLEQKRHGVTQLYVYENIVKDMFLISYSTFNRWLAYPAKQELKRGKLAKPENKKQLSLTF